MHRTVAIALACGTAMLAVPPSAAQVRPDAQPADVQIRATTSLTLGTALPDTGGLSAYGPATQAAVGFAVADANSVGGVMGADVTLIAGDSGGTGSRTFARTLAAMPEAQAIVGPLSSALVLDNLDAVDGRTIISPAAVSAGLSGVIARTVPAEPLAGAMLATLAKQRGALRLAVVGPRSQEDLVDAALDRSADVQLAAVSVVYPKRQQAAKIAKRIARTSADAMLLASGAETTDILQELIRRGMPARIFLAPVAADSVDPRQLRRGTLDGAQAVELDLRVPRSLQRRLAVTVPDAPQTAYAAQAYDAAAIAILAAEASGILLGEITAEGIRTALPSVTSVGEPCKTLVRCLRLLRSGADIDYVGYAGPYDLDTAGDPEAARYLVRTYGAGNRPGSTARPVAYP